jgi:RimJ/RimL family protein N-acetyltransferase
MKVAVRRARVEDIEACLDLYADVAAEAVHIGGEAPIDRAARRTDWLEALSRADAVRFVAVKGDAIVGIGGLDGDRVADLGMLVAPGWRGRGIGTMLMEALIDWARQVGAHKIALQVWPHNDAAIALYKRFGFEQEGYLRKHWRRRNGELWDAVVMGLILTDQAQ